MTVRNRVGVVSAVALFALFANATPAAAQSLTATNNNQQVVPPGGSSCPSLPVLDIVPHVYGNELHSFDVVVSDPSYVALAGMVGETPIPFHYMTRSAGAAGTVRIHVDTPSTPLAGATAVSLTMLSASSGVTCLGSVSFTIAGSLAAVPSQPTAVPPITPPTSATPAAPSEPTESDTPLQSETEYEAPTVAGPVAAGSGLGSTILRACTTAGGALQLWFVLLTIFLLLVATAAVAEPPLAERNTYLPAAIIGIPLVLLLAFWLLASQCRGAWWVPVLALGVALVASVWAYRKRPEVTKVIHLPASMNTPKKPVVEPEAKKKGAN